MASIYDLKPRFQALLRPITRRLATWRVTANQVTLAAVVLSIAAGGLLTLYHDSRIMLLTIPVVLLVRMALNAIDGMLAREHQMKSALGAMLNELGDVVADAAIYLPFALVPGVSSWLVVVAVVLGVIGEMAGVVAIQVGAERRYDGPFGKSDRALAFSVIAVMIGFGAEPGRWLDGILAIMIVLAAMTIVNRARRALAHPTPAK